jgi:hypothetical protein
MAEVLCNDGTVDVSNGGVKPCIAHGGVATQEQTIIREEPKTMANRDYWKNQLSIKKLVFNSYPIMLGLTGYGVYKLGKLPDSVNNERLKVVGAIAGGGGIVLLTALGCAWGGCNDKTKIPISFGVGGFVGGLTYLTSRTLFKQNPKNSLIASAILGGIGIAYAYTEWESNHNNNDKQDIGSGREVVSQPITPTPVAPLIIK